MHSEIAAILSVAEGTWMSCDKHNYKHQNQWQKQPVTKKMKRECLQ